MVPPFRDCKRASGASDANRLPGVPDRDGDHQTRGKRQICDNVPLTTTSSTLTKPSETVGAGSKVPSALPANTRDVCVALGLVCACSCEQETVSSQIPGKECQFGMPIAQRRNA